MSLESETSEHIFELLAFKYAVSGQVQSGNPEIEKVLYIVQHYNFLELPALMEKLEECAPDRGPCPPEVAQALLKGFRDGQHYTQIESMK